jgi:hypothetical protein
VGVGGSGVRIGFGAGVEQYLGDQGEDV